MVKFLVTYATRPIRNLMDNFLPTRFQALGDPTRLAVIERLLEGPASVSTLTGLTRDASAERLIVAAWWSTKVADQRPTQFDPGSLDQKSQSSPDRRQPLAVQQHETSVLHRGHTTATAPHSGKLHAQLVALDRPVPHHLAKRPLTLK